MTYTERHKRYYQKHKTRIIANIRAHYRANETIFKYKQLKTRYNLTVEQFNEMLEKQENKCSICGIEFLDKTRPHVDHDHSCCAGAKSCGKCVRSLLCNRCNRAIGLFGDSLLLVQKAAEYLKEYSEKHVEG